MSAPDRTCYKAAGFPECNNDGCFMHGHQGRELAGRLAAQKPLVPHTVLGEVMRERERQEARFGEQNHPMWVEGRPTGADADDGSVSGWSYDYYGVPSEKRAKWLCETEAKSGRQSYMAILVEEVAEAVSAQDEAHARAELIQVAAVAVAMCEAIDRRRSK